MKRDTYVSLDDFKRAIRAAHVRGFMWGVFIWLPLGAAIGWMAR